MNKEEILNKLKKAYQLLISKDGYLFEIDVNERSLTHKLAEYLEEEFSNFDVDCEYNRKGINPKKLESFKQKIDSNDTNAVTVYPDIIIHKRGENDNLVVIEAKKTSFSGKNEDEEKLKAYKKDLKYKFAFKIIFPVKEEFKKIKDISKYIGEIKNE